ncbi:hypothetical protein A2852_02860 [Candidatus Adlerbacteria bacterium RIFCSPHIGHO2_01_FULL_54_23]|uniref:DUF192 domain-containing protein n=3 Tax=Candidatus Adleribacteriota TaxID=1752736 RepID=A0A1F4Y066_9BACT|nr:MAG: hypothetical protein UY83_C0006G0044 [Candidatus Adlerbacteria bacterium GW2011_GWA1_54_10]KKW37708.1 MAG: hypothetical protein UY86_C0004G0037 [Candidatus Adlerbacteria bacterium GW2011_GWB1_54_7]OGC79529.1 MAG: hypothetical protein A2852_02860 [Candidatus Adlerbacteria bacterium RIFCSPHIGHO2_01_FULL_54_23]OGC87176.1 MAG: hypothetical protein A3B33_01220 [Candidatus Adlerbacteria bacterium RIFCSPLOWO2_01_FULL_54_16]
MTVVARYLIVLILMAAVIAAAIVFSNYQQGRILISIGGAKVEVEIADSTAERIRGLSGRDPLPEGKGMLFIFESDGYHGIWMRDMRFALDIVWADAKGKIVTVARNVAPETYPKVFEPSALARYVLEVPAGFAKRNSIAEGDKIVLK